MKGRFDRRQRIAVGVVGAFLVLFSVGAPSSGGCGGSGDDAEMVEQAATSQDAGDASDACAADGGSCGGGCDPATEDEISGCDAPAPSGCTCPADGGSLGFRPFSAVGPLVSVMAAGGTTNTCSEWCQKAKDCAVATAKDVYKWGCTNGAAACNWAKRTWCKAKCWPRMLCSNGSCSKQYACTCTCNNNEASQTQYYDTCTGAPNGATCALSPLVITGGCGGTLSGCK